MSTMRYARCGLRDRAEFAALLELDRGSLLNSKQSKLAVVKLWNKRPATKAGSGIRLPN
jgi:hypothetical protein